MGRYNGAMSLPQQPPPVEPTIAHVHRANVVAGRAAKGQELETINRATVEAYDAMRAILGRTNINGPNNAVPIVTNTTAITTGLPIISSTPSYPSRQDWPPTNPPSARTHCEVPPTA